MTVPNIIDLIAFRTSRGTAIFITEQTLNVNSDAEIIVGAIHKEDFTNLLFQINNSGANSLDFAFYGSAENDIVASNLPHEPPPDYDGTTALWTLLPEGTGSVATSNSDARFVSDPWTWILITVKRTTAGQSTTGLLSARAV